MLVVVAGIILTATNTGIGQTSSAFSAYQSLSTWKSFAGELQKRSPATVALHSLATSPGGNEVWLLEIGSNLKNGPAIFVAANLEGISPLASSGAAYLAQLLLDSSRYRQDVRWYVLPVGNPDAYARYLEKPLFASTLNALDVNEDVDDQVNEDGPEDLNGDGWITQMRQKAPDGQWMVSQSDNRFLVKADPARSEKGTFKVFTEGTDNDGDGQYNEDGQGGVNPGINFPHDFQNANKEAGLFPGVTPESYGIMKFIYEHPEIIMTVTLGESNLLADLPAEAKSDFDPNRIRIPERLARMTGLSPTQTYKMEDIFRELANRYPDQEIDENLVLANLGSGPEKSFKKSDIGMYEALAKEYKTGLTSKGIVNRMAPEKPRPGSFELWSYFNLGVPSIALSLWEPEAKKDTATDKKTTAISGKPGTGGMPGSATAAEKPVPQEKQWLDFFDHSQIKGFAEWKSFHHPQLGEVEIGGFIPYATNTPPAGEIQKLLEVQIPFVASLATRIPRIRMAGEKVTSLGGDIVRLEVFIENTASLPYPTEMGRRNQQPAPIILSLDTTNAEILQGLARTPVTSIGGNQVKKLTFMLKAKRRSTLNLRLEGVAIMPSQKTVSLNL